MASDDAVTETMFSETIENEQASLIGSNSHVSSYSFMSIQCDTRYRYIGVYLVLLVA